MLAIASFSWADDDGDDKAEAGDDKAEAGDDKTEAGDCADCGDVKSVSSAGAQAEAAERDSEKESLTMSSAILNVARIWRHSSSVRAKVSVYSR